MSTPPVKPPAKPPATRKAPRGDLKVFLIVGGGAAALFAAACLALVLAVVLSNRPAPGAVAAEDLVRAFRGNAVAADAQYQGKGVLVSGIVHHVSRDDGQPVLYLQGPAPDGKVSHYVACRGLGDAALAAARPGDRVTVRGTCAGANLLGDVLLTGCTLVK